MAQITLTYTFSPNTLIASSQMNTDLATDIVATYNAHDTAVNSVHGVSSGAIVGTTMTQTLANKTLTSPVITGSVAFDTDTLYVDSTSDRVGMGLTDPIYRLHVRDQGGNDPAVFEFNSASGTPYINLRTSKGSYAAKTIVTSGDAFGIRALGWDGANYQNIAGIVFSVDGTPGIGDMPGRIGLWTSPDGSTSIVEHFRINQAGTVSIKSGGRFCLDGLDGLGDTYWIESSSNVASLFRGGTEQVRFGSGVNNFLAGNIYIASTNAFYWDGGSDTYTYHPSSNLLADVVGGVYQFLRTDTYASFSDSLTIGHNPAIGSGSSSGAFSPVLSLNAGEATRISTLDFRAVGVQKGKFAYQHDPTQANEVLKLNVAGKEFWWTNTYFGPVSSSTTMSLGNSGSNAHWNNLHMFGGISFYGSATDTSADFTISQSGGVLSLSGDLNVSGTGVITAGSSPLYLRGENKLVTVADDALLGGQATIDTGNGKAWGLFGYTAAGDAASNGYVEVSINGTLIKLSTRA